MAVSILFPARKRLQDNFLKKIRLAITLVVDRLGFLIPQDDRGVKKIFLRQKKSRSDFFWRRPLGCVLKETYAEGGKKRLVTCVDKETYAEGGKKRLVTCVDKASLTDLPS